MAVTGWEFSVDCMVFGSNAAGPGNRAAAVDAAKYYGASSLLAEGLQNLGTKGTSYGIPTKGHLLNKLTLGQIRESVNRFLQFARSRPDLNFLVTRVGCGASGYSDEEIAPMFKGAPENCGFDPAWGRFELKSWAKAPHWTKPSFAPKSATQQTG